MWLLLLKVPSAGSHSLLHFHWPATLQPQIQHTATLSRQQLAVEQKIWHSLVKCECDGYLFQEVLEEKYVNSTWLVARYGRFTPTFHMFWQPTEHCSTTSQLRIHCHYVRLWFHPSFYWITAQQGSTSSNDRTTGRHTINDWRQHFRKKNYCPV